MKLLGDWNWYLPGWLEWLPGKQREHAPPIGAAASAPTD
jgi:RND superfamily putative drug exporter